MARGKQVLKPLWVYTEGRRNILPRGIFDLGKDGFTMKISQFTKHEIDEILADANFTDLERDCFLLKSKGKTNIELSMALSICDSTVSTTMKSVRAKITSVLEEKASAKSEKPSGNTLNPIVQYLTDLLNKVLENSPLVPESHTTKEWAELPDRVSIKDKWYVVTDYRTDEDISVPRFKYGDGTTLISKLPFVTAAITDNDVLWWDLKAQKI